MKILVPIDFRNTSFSALCYANKIAHSVGGSLTLLHVIDYKAKINEYLDEELIEVMKQSVIERLKHFSTAIPLTRSIHLEKVETDYEVIYGDPGGTISQIATIDDYDLVIMGIRDKLNFIARLTGSTATYVINHSKVPIIMVHASTKFVPPKKIVFAFDDRSDLDDGIEAFDKINRELKASTDFVHVMTDKVTNVQEMTEEIVEALFEDNDPNFSFQIKTIKEAIPTQALYDYCLFEKADLLAMIHRKDGILDLLLNRSQTIKAAFEFHLPVLVIPD